MRLPEPAKLGEITAVAEKWLRRCNGHPQEGKLTTAVELRAVLAVSTDVAVDKKGVITWIGAGRPFSAEPVRPEPET